MTKLVNITLSVIADAERDGIVFLKRLSCHGGTGGSGGGLDEPYLQFDANEVIDRMNAIIAKAMKLRGLAESALDQKGGAPLRLV